MMEWSVGSIYKITNIQRDSVWCSEGEQWGVYHTDDEVVRFVHVEEQQRVQFTEWFDDCTSDNIAMSMENRFELANWRPVIECPFSFELSTIYHADFELVFHVRGGAVVTGGNNKQLWAIPVPK